MTMSDTTELKQWVYSFGQADPTRRDLLGGKGAELAQMTSLGLPVPPGFTITTEAFRDYYDSGRWLPEGLWPQVREAMQTLEEQTGRRFGDPDNPLLVSVRSGAAVSMPGMMDTVLNLGINMAVADGLAKNTGNRRFALDVHRRFIQMFGDVVLGVDSSILNAIISEEERRRGVTHASDLCPQELRQLIATLRAAVSEAAGTAVPDDPYQQLEQAIRAVFDSWDSRRAIAYRELNSIPHDLGTAVSVVSMVYGNMDRSSCSGVLFTRNPSTGEDALFGEYLVNAQGEDVVAGTATPKALSEMTDEMPAVYEELARTAKDLERHYSDVQDVEFTVEQERLYILQTRSGKRSARAAIKTAVDLANEGLITVDEALLRVEPDQMYQLLLPTFDEGDKELATTDRRLMSIGLGAAPGAATGKLVLDADTATELAGRGVEVILARTETSAEDIHGMAVSSGVLTSKGGATSHAAVVARGLGKPCVTGAEGIEVNVAEGWVRADNLVVRAGEDISIDGTTGEIFARAIATVMPTAVLDDEVATLLEWADERRTLGVWANADGPVDAAAAVGFGAEGIGLCRTEHMFFDPARLAVVQTLILSAHKSTQSPENDIHRARYEGALVELEELQTADFEGIFREMGGRPVVVRLLDPPLHEFLPRYEDLATDIAERRAGGEDSAALAEKEALLVTVAEMREANPMLGLRGCRVGILYPEIYGMQVRAIVRAARNVETEGVVAHPEIMVPLVSHANEMAIVRSTIENSVLEAAGPGDEYQIGVMIETPRAALTAGEIAESAEFFSFGTNDLTQTAFAFSRDDAEGKYLSQYVEKEILNADPFQTLDIEGVGSLVRMASEAGRRARPGLSLGICGEHGGDPASIAFFHEVGLDYVSCSPYRVPVARLAAAQAALRANAN